MMKYWIWFIPLAVCLGIIGCSESKPTEDTSGVDTTAVAPVAIGLQDITIAKLDQEIAQLRGKVVLLDVWFYG